MNRDGPGDRLVSLIADGWHPYALIVAAICVVYTKTVFFDFTYLDDSKLILYNAPFLGDLGHILQAFRQKVFAHGYLSYYRPLLVVSFILDAQWAGVLPFAFHATNVAIHGAASCLLFLFFLRLGYARIAAAVFALIFAVHPLLTQAVAWIPGRNDSLLAVFALAAFLAFPADDAGRKASFPGWHLLFYGLALFTKESAVVVPVVCLAYRWMERGRIGPLRSAATLLAGYAAVTALWYGVRLKAVGDPLQMNLFDMGVFFVRYLPAIPQLIGKAFFPFRLSVFPVMQDVPVWPGIVAVLLVVAAIRRSPAARHGPVFFGCLWIFLFLLPGLIRPHAGVINDVLEHRFYLPMAGLMVILMETDIVKGRCRTPGFLAGAAFVVVLFAGLAFRHADDFRDRTVFWESAVATSPSSPFARLALGAARYDAGAYRLAEEALRASVAIDAHLIQNHYYLGLIALQEGRLAEAEKEFRKEIALNARFDGPYSSLGVVYYRQGRFDEADAVWRRGLAIKPDDAELLRNLAILSRERGRIDDARRYAARLRGSGVAVPAWFPGGEEGR